MERQRIQKQTKEDKEELKEERKKEFPCTLKKRN